MEEAYWNEVCRLRNSEPHRLRKSFEPMGIVETTGQPIG